MSCARLWLMVMLLGHLVVSSAGEVRYEYDDAGRLRHVTYPDASQRAYTLDAAGNRTQQQDANAPGIPGSITVPSSSSSGSYTVSWTAPATGTVTSYQLYEATNSGFSDEVQRYSGAGTSTPITGKGNGAYYYRVRACNGAVCGNYRTASNAVTVALPPGTPASISVPATSTTGSYTIDWGAASGTLTAYELYESTSSSFATQTLVYSGTVRSKAIAGKGNGTYYYRVRACNGGSCSNYRTDGSTTVTLPPDTPVSITVPATSTTGSYTIDWGTASGALTAYELYESTSSSFATQTLVYSGTAKSKAISGKGDGAYYYRVRACNGAACSGFVAGSNATTVTVPPSMPASITVPASSITGGYTVSWGTSSGTLTKYELYESTSSTFSTQSLVYGNTATSRVFANQDNGTYYYRVRACNGSLCSDYKVGANATVVTLPPGGPGWMSAPAASTTGSYTISWGTPIGTVTAYELYESATSSFATQTLVYSGTVTSKEISGKGNGVYYYRVRACNGSVCSGYVTYPSPVTVTLPPGTPVSISVPASSTTGSYTISWGTASGTLTAYELYESTSSSFTTQTLAYSGTGISKAISGKGNGAYYYRVRACNGSSCSDYRTGGSSMTVTLPPGTPASITVPASSSTGSYTISWGAASGAVTAYELYESTSSSFATQTLAYSGTATSKAISGKGNGVYYYRVRACNGAACGGYITGPSATVTLPPGTPASISVPSGSTSGSYTVSWGTASGTLTTYELYESTSSSFSAQTLVYSGTATSKAISGKANGSYYYRVRACNGSSCSGYRTGGNATAVTLVPNIPASITVPATSTSGTYTINWGSSPCCNAITHYELYEATNSGFSGQQLIVSAAVTSHQFTKSPGATYYYRVRACYQSACSSYRTGANGVTVQTASTVSISNMSIGGGGYYPSGVSAYYMLDSTGDIRTTPSSGVGSGGTVVDVGDWLSPKVGMGDFQARASASCSGITPVGIFNTWRPLSQGQAWGASFNGWNNSGSCTITVSITSDNGVTIVGGAVISISLWAGE